MNVMKLKPIIALAALAACPLGAGIGVGAGQRFGARRAMTARRRSISTADRAEAQDRADRAIFAGNVVVRQGSLTLRTARLTLAYASQDGIDINRIDASGGVTVTSPSETARREISRSTTSTKG